MTEEPQKTPLWERHRALGARMTPFGGWDMPLQYEGILAEHAWTCRNCAGDDFMRRGARCQQCQ